MGRDVEDALDDLLGTMDEIKRKIIDQECPHCYVEWGIREAEDGDGYDFNVVLSPENVNKEDETATVSCTTCGITRQVDLAEGQILGEDLIDMNCPICDIRWSVWKSEDGQHHFAGLESVGSSGGYGRTEVQCNDCNHIRRLQIE